jgi:hypothetical protein
MRYKYVGDVEGFELFGYKFPIGESVEVTSFINKLSNNSHFEECFSSGLLKKKAAKHGNGSTNKRQGS